MSRKLFFAVTLLLTLISALSAQAGSSSRTASAATVPATTAATSAATQPAADGSRLMAASDQGLADAVNAYRKENQIDEVRINAQLMNIAAYRAFAQLIPTTNLGGDKIYEDTLPRGYTYNEMWGWAGYTAGFGAKSALDVFLANPDLKKTLLDDAWNDIGAALVCDVKRCSFDLIFGYSSVGIK